MFAKKKKYKAWSPINMPALKPHTKCGFSVTQKQFDKTTSLEHLNKELMKLNADERLRVYNAQQELIAEGGEIGKAIKYEEAQEYKKELQDATAMLTAQWHQLPFDTKQKFKDKWDFQNTLINYQEARIKANAQHHTNNVTNNIPTTKEPTKTEEPTETKTPVKNKTEDK